MGKIVRDLDEYNLKTCINKLRDLSVERVTLKHQLDELIEEYMALERQI
ncbi:hypothetical protein [Clostridium tagluense]|uniref:Uncharacterized protein n=1 Tax=Clostridium tagluense TaxID=360422 RepID=A0A401URR7_9CLOT|nr:hypothetical protein [Clostridium tagluense]GCD12227.1 hypothetical protein Ctaglu_38500 [Clostridium tagluense]